MLMIKSEPVFGPSGLASLAVAGGQVQMIFDANNEIVSLPLSALPVPFDKKVLPLNKKYMVSLDGTRTKITGLRPATGSPVCEFREFKRGINDPIPFPQQPRQKIGKTRDGQPYPKNWLEFTARCFVIDEVYTGLEIPVKMRYYFTSNPDGLTVIKGEGQHSVFISRFLECSLRGRVVKIPFSDNILPALEAFLKEHGHPFMITMSNGWPEGFGEVSSAYLKVTKVKAKPKTAAKRK